MLARDDDYETKKLMNKELNINKYMISFYGIIYNWKVFLH